MTTAAVSQRAVAALAALVHEIRSDWNEPGIAAELRRCAVPLPDLAIAVIRGAQDPDNDSPAFLRYPNNRAWDDDRQWRCKTHPDTRSRRTNGECSSCWADRQAVPEPVIPQRQGQPIPEAARKQILDAIRGTYG